ncbi:MAG: hypothetical protein EBY43_05040 [Opitutae bacterium]|nr:hypothetical protein [Opitutae bacterium]
MSKQYNKLIKRRRRAAYLARRKKALAAAAKEEPTSVAAEVKASDKATAADVLGPDAGTPEVGESKETATSTEE